MYLLLKGSVYCLRNQDKERMDLINSPTRKNLIIGREATDFLRVDEEKIVAASSDIKLSVAPNIRGSHVQKSNIQKKRELINEKNNRKALTALLADSIKKSNILDKETGEVEQSLKEKQINQSVEQLLAKQTNAGEKFEQSAEPKHINPQIKAKLDIVSTIEEEEEEKLEVQKKIMFVRESIRLMGKEIAVSRLSRMHSNNVEDYHHEDDDEQEKDEMQAQFPETLLKSSYPRQKVIAKVSAPDYFGEVAFQDSSKRYTVYLLLELSKSYLSGLLLA